MREGFGDDSASLSVDSFRSFFDTKSPNTDCEVLNMPYEGVVSPVEMPDAILSLSSTLVGGLKRLGSLKRAGGRGRDGRRGSGLPQAQASP